MEVKNLNPENSITFFEEGNLRIHSVSKMCTIDDGVFYYSSMPATYGVGIEASNDGGHSYLVLSFVNPSAEGYKTKVKPVDSRVREFKQKNPENAALYNKVKKMAKQIVEDALKEKGK